MITKRTAHHFAEALPRATQHFSQTTDVVTAQDRSVELFHRVNEQDFAACERTQPAMSSKAYREGGVLVPSEHHIGAFHTWVRSLIG
ncbi:SRPBCC family protein [Streptomyces sp. T028]|uniref:SRPBCC family protein n=1 Tax=Streptomyces sp. T028 TaxID=3394379 RepID=UPI003A8BB860